MIEQQNLIYVGVDLHKQHHTAVFIDCWSKKLGELKFENKPSAFPLLLKELKKYTKEGLSVVFGLEDVGGYGRGLAVFLKDNGCWVKEVNAKLANARRQSHVTVQKSDSWDAECVAKVLRDDLERLPDAKPIDLYWAISQLVTQRHWLTKNLTGMVKKLHQQISYPYPSYKKFFSEVEGKTAIAFWEAYPSPHTLSGVTEEDLAGFLRKHSNNGLSLKKANQILSLIAEDGDTYRDFQEARDTVVVSQVKTISYLKQEIAGLEAEIERLMKQLGF